MKQFHFYDKDDPRVPRSREEEAREAFVGEQARGGRLETKFYKVLGWRKGR